MTADPSTDTEDTATQGTAAGEAGTALECSVCHSCAYLSIESIHGLRPKVPGRVAVEYSCDQCGTTQLCDAAVEAVAKVLAKVPTASGVLKIGRQYIHCGEPMQRVNYQRSTLNLPDPFEQAKPLFNTPVLRCHCGFQLAVPVRPLHTAPTHR